MNVQADSFEDYLAQIDEGMVETTSRVLDLMRRELPEAREDVRWGIAILSVDGRDVTGIAARKGHYSLYVPHAEVHGEYVERLGKVDAGKGCIRFKDPGDLKFGELRKMVRDLEKAARSDEARLRAK